MVDCIQLHINKNVNMVLTTHSPHFVTSIIKMISRYVFGGYSMKMSILELKNEGNY